jgi:NADH-quinone oxidoreductase subunit G
VTDRADVVFPVAAAVEKAGTYLDWEGRARPYEAVLTTSGALTDARVLDALATELARPLGLPDLAAVRAEISRIGTRVPLVSSELPPAPGASVRTHEGELSPEAEDMVSEGDTLPTPPEDTSEPTPVASSQAPPDPGADVRTQEGQATLATWHLLLDDGSLQDGEPHLAGTARSPRLHLNATTAASLGAADGDAVTVSTERGSLTLPLVIADLPDDVVWVPTRTRGAHVRTDLAAAHGDPVVLSKGATA